MSETNTLVRKQCPPLQHKYGVHWPPAGTWGEVMIVCEKCGNVKR